MCSKCAGSEWKVCGKRLVNAQEVSGEDVLKVVGFAELSANTRKAPP